jgi:LuxR family transcriptional regulator, maltose regulon positive regulatory protein
VRHDLVARTQLLERLSGSQARLTLLAAGAGWGKTTLLAQWRASEERRFAWLSLDQADNDPARFWAYVVTALRQNDPKAAETMLALLRAPGTDIAETVLPALLNGFHTDALPCVLVLDDYHAITSSAIQAQLRFFLERLPATLRLVIASRSDPPLQLARLRARGELFEVRADELRFSDPESSALLNDLLGLELAGDDVANLNARTEGWAAGLYLTALSLQRQDDPRAFLDSFSGDERHLVDYLGAEVLAGLSARERTFLLRSSVLERLCGSLCDAVTGLEDSLGMLERIERSNLFVVPLDNKRVWYRYHHLFGELLRHELKSAEPALVPELHRRASAWYLEHDAIADAVEHALAADDFALAPELIAEHWKAATDDGQLVTVVGWLAQLPQETLEGDTRLCLAKAWLALNLGQLEDVPYWLERLERLERGRATRPLLSGTSAAATAPAIVRAAYCYVVGDTDGAREAARAVLELEGKDSPWHSVALATLGGALRWSGDNVGAIDAFEEALRLARSTNKTIVIVALGHLAVIRAEDAELDRAEAILEQTDELASEIPGLATNWISNQVHLARGTVLGERGQLVEAEAALTRALALARRGGARLEIAHSLLVLARLLRRLDRRNEARAVLGEARRVTAECPRPGILPDLLATAEKGFTRGAHGNVRSELSEREFAVLRLLTTRLTLREIGGELFVSENTVKTHARSIYRKLNATSRAEAVAGARELNLL